MIVDNPWEYGDLIRTPSGCEYRVMRVSGPNLTIESQKFGWTMVISAHITSDWQAVA